MQVETKNFQISEDSEGVLTVTAKSGFTIRLAPSQYVTGVHIMGKSPGTEMLLISSRTSKASRPKTQTVVSLFEVDEKA